MKILIAPDKFKGSLSAIEVCDAIERGIKRFDSTIEIIKHPLADGGEGTLDILNNHFKLETISVLVKDPLFNDITATYKVSENTAFIEMSNASGLQLLNLNQRNCYYTSTFGTGQLILDAIKKGFKEIILFIGGSATNDAGIGMAAALGYCFYNLENQILNPIGKELINISRIENENLFFDINEINFTVVCDVKNPLYGENGAAYVYGKQKGASFEEIKLLDLGLQNFSNQVLKYLNQSIANNEGAGAAGGLGAGAICFLKAKIKSGIDFVIEQTQFKQHLNNKIDLIITGEGSVDKQTLEGKAVKGISDISTQYNIPYCIISGITKDKGLVMQSLKPKSIKSVMELNVSFDDAIQNASKHIENIAFEIIKGLKENEDTIL
ncbi:MAG: glycerate kinase [Flavobacteriaceae bacterium]|nr:glycerate kinase [Flavobacteriaceae bacterium]